MSVSLFSEIKVCGPFFFSNAKEDQSTLLDGKVLSNSSVALDRTLCISSWIFQDPMVRVSLLACSIHNKISQAECQEEKIFHAPSSVPASKHFREQTQ